MKDLTKLRSKFLIWTLITTAPLALFAQDEVAFDDEVYELSPFVVETDKNVGYLATSTLAGTRLNTELKDVGSSISVVTAEFLKDTGAVDNESLLVYTTNTEVGGVDGNFTNVGNGTASNEEGNFLQSHNSTRVRGLTAADNTREYFLTDFAWDGYNVERVDLQRGPNSILFGLGSPAGIINTDLKDAQFNKDAGVVEARYGRFDSLRFTLDYNKVILEDELAIRINTLTKRQKFQQEPAYADDDRIYAALKYEPKFLQTDSARTTIRVNVESGEQTSNRPRSLTPGDQLTQWFDGAGKVTVNPYDVEDAYSKRPNTGQNNNTYDDGTMNPYYSPYLGNWGQLYGGLMAFYDADSSEMMGSFLKEEIGSNFTPHGNAIGGVAPTGMFTIASYNSIAGNLGLPNSDKGQYKNIHIQDASIFDFYHKLVDGPNKREFQQFDALNFNISQGFFNEKVGFEFVYDDQNYSNEQLKLLGGERQTIYVDINETLVDGSTNPNLGRPFLSDAGRYGNNESHSQRENIRFSAYADLNVSDLTKKDNWLTKLAGRHIVSGVYSKNNVRQDQRQFQRYVSDSAFGNAIGEENVTVNARQINTVHYLGGSLLNATSAAGANLPNIGAVQKPQDGTVRYFDTHWNATGVNYMADWMNPITGEAMMEADNPANYVGWTNAPFRVLDSSDPDERSQTYTQVRLSKDEIESKVMVWQGYLWDGAIVGTYGYREDTAKNWAAGAPKNSDGTVNLSDFALNGDANSIVEGNTKSWSVVAHLDEFLAEDTLPVNFSLFYNTSKNFQPAAGRVDVLGNALPAPQGDTEDYGFMVSTKDNKYALRFNWYETTVLNDSNDTVSATMWAIGIVENWAHNWATIFRDDFGGNPDFVPKDGMSPEDTAALEAASIAAWFANPPTEMLAGWGADTSIEARHGNRQTAEVPSGMTATSDTTSKGVEMELLMNPTNNWRISFNASRTEAVKNNVGGALAEYVDARLKHYEGPAGDMRIWWGGGDNIRWWWANTFLGNYELMKLTEGTAVPELREWRFNAITNYSFSDGAFEGLNIGGGLRWQDEVAIGYPLMDDADGNVTFDIENPYMGEARTNFDLWAGYERPINDKIDWRIQINVRNAFAQNELITISTQPDGSAAAVRIAPGMSWEITNTFSF